MNEIRGAQSACAADTATTLLLTREFISSHVPTGAYVAAVRRAFEQLGNRQIEVAPVGHVRGFGGAFHIKSATGLISPRRVAIKINGNFPDNPRSLGLPTIQGVIALFDAECGRLLALLDSAEVTAQRTAAASVVAAQVLARRDAHRIALIGCGMQARYHLAAMLDAFVIDSVMCHDMDTGAAEDVASRAAARGIAARVTSSARDAAMCADIVITTTSSRAPVLGADDVEPGCFIAAVGADNPDKHEIHPELLSRTRVVPDILAQALAMGDLHHAIEDGSMSSTDVHGELTEVLTGKVPGRTDSKQIFVFDSTGTAIADLAATELIFDIARVEPDAPRLRMAA